MNRLFKLKIVLASALLLPLLAIANSEENNEAIIKITAKGFEPKEITVTQGEEVVFINNDTKLHWPASDFHPTHGIYPQFDSMEGITPGDSWKFKFDKPGLWRMHDHLAPYFTGNITVLTASSTNTLTETTEPKTGFWNSIKNFFKRIFN